MALRAGRAPPTCGGAAGAGGLRAHIPHVARVLISAGPSAARPLKRRGLRASRGSGSVSCGNGDIGAGLRRRRRLRGAGLSRGAELSAARPGVCKVWSRPGVPSRPGAGGHRLPRRVPAGQRRARPRRAMPLGHIMRLDLERLALEYVVPCLHDIGFCYLDNFLGEVVGDCVLERVKRMHRDGELADGQLAGPSRGVAKRHLRGDQIKWIGGTEEGCEAINFLLTLIDRLVMYCGSRLGKYYVKERSKVSGAARGCGRFPAPGPGTPRRADPVAPLRAAPRALSWGRPRRAGSTDGFPEWGVARRLPGASSRVPLPRPSMSLCRVPAAPRFPAAGTGTAVLGAPCRNSPAVSSTVLQGLGQVDGEPLRTRLDGAAGLLAAVRQRRPN